jgi:hypothetical protein
MLVRRGLTGLLVLGASVLGYLPIASAAPRTTTLVPTVEAWYQPDPTCGLPSGCLVAVPDPPVTPPVPPPAPATSPYPSGSLHVAVDAGQETARTYLTYALPEVDAQLTAATLDVPLDPAAQDGSVSPDVAKVAVCTFNATLSRVEGAVAAPPTAACTASATMTYAASPAPHLTADLGPLLARIAEGNGIVLVPDASKTAGTDTWHVVFSAHDRADAAKTPPASLTLTLESEETATEDEASPAPALQAAPPAFPVTGLSPGNAVAAPVVPAAPQLSPALPLPPVQTVRFGYAYPAVWMLPLVFLIGVPLVGRTMTREVLPT